MGKRTHAPGKLAAVALKKLADGWHADGGNLYLFVRGESRGWVFRFTGPDGVRKNMGLGSLDSISLAEARSIAASLRGKVKHPITPTDPLIERQKARDAARVAKLKRITFKACAEEYIEAHRAGWKNAKHASQWASTLETYAYPVIGNLPVADIDGTLVLKCLKPIWTEKNETASRVRNRIELVLGMATAKGYRQGDNPARWRGNMDNLLPKPSKVQKQEHHAALPYAEIGAFLADLRTRQGVAASALEFLILTAARTGEVIGAKWEEINLQDAAWTIPAERMKAEKEHKVPLTSNAVKILESLPREDGNPFVFIGGVQGKGLSNMSMLNVLKRMERSDLTVHGFRSTFRDWAGECSSFPREVIEHALAHQLADKAEAAYQRGTLFNKRRKLIEAWTDYCCKTQNVASVTPIRGAA